MITGRVRLSGLAPVDSMVSPDRDSTGCRPFQDVTLPKARGANSRDSVAVPIANAVAWLANTLGRLGIGLKAGEVILSGSQSPLVPVTAGDNLRCDVGGLGGTSVRFI